MLVLSGLASSTVPMYIAECSPSQQRGKLVTVNNLCITGGQFIASIVAGLFSHDYNVGWRYVLVLIVSLMHKYYIGIQKNKTNHCRQIPLGNPQSHLPTS